MEVTRDGEVVDLCRKMQGLCSGLSRDQEKEKKVKKNLLRCKV
jgi:hypothetical protein